MRGHIGRERDHSRNIMIDWDGQVYIRRARETESREGLLVTISLEGVYSGSIYLYILS